MRYPALGYGEKRLVVAAAVFVVDEVEAVAAAAVVVDDVEAVRAFVYEHF